MISRVVYTSGTIPHQVHLKVISNRIINQQPFLLATASNLRNRTTSYCGLFVWKSFVYSYNVMFVWHVKQLIMNSSARITKDHLPCKHNVTDSTTDSTDSCYDLYSCTYLRSSGCRVLYHGLPSTLKDSMII